MLTKKGYVFFRNLYISVQRAWVSNLVYISDINPYGDFAFLAFRVVYYNSIGAVATNVVIVTAVPLCLVE